MTDRPLVEMTDEQFSTFTSQSRRDRAGYFRFLRRLLITGFCFLALLEVATWWFGEHDSCLRGNALRHALNQRGVVLSTIHPQSASRFRAIPLLRCSRLTPDTSRPTEDITP